ncbi:MAG: adenylosuccinate lyase [Flavobacteriaceae bacterium]
MAKNWIASVLDKMENPKRENRDKAANTVWEHPENFKYLLEMTFDVDNKQSIKAAWVLEWICTHKGLDILVPHLNEFVNNISKVHFDSATRPCAKICEHLAHAYTSKKENLVKEVLTQEHIEKIIETGFDWLITPQKIAVRAYTMTTLYLFGLEKDWVHPELKHLISSKIIHESKGCKARGRYVIDLIEKQQKRSQ